MRCFFASDLHGHGDRYLKLFREMERGRPDVVLLGGDLLPAVRARDFFEDTIRRGFDRTRTAMGEAYPRVLVILGNDDGRLLESEFRQTSIWEYLHARSVLVEAWRFWGYAYVPPTPFLLKDWERYDVSRYVDPGCVPPDEGARSIDTDEEELRRTIAQDLERLVGGLDLARSIMLFHSPPYGTAIDVADLQGTSVDHAPLDPHVGSIAIRRFIESGQPAVTLHGHVHESASLTGTWRDRIGRTHVLGAAHRGPELALVVFDPVRPEEAERWLL
jgi:Icc-related predicted phosphoesterase